MYACALLLRNCGHYTMVRSDFGSDYVTCRFLSEESMYAGMTREATRTFGRIEEKMSSEFRDGYDIPKRPIWFTPGVFVDRELAPLREVEVGKMMYNVIDEAVPVTNKNTVYDKKGNRGLKERNNIATFGSIEAVLPGQRVLSIAVSLDKQLLERYHGQDVFMMGKKRTMFELLHVSEVVELKEEEGLTDTVPVQVQMEQLNEYHSYTMHDVNARYFLVEGRAAKSWSLDVELGEQRLQRALPDLFIERALQLFGSEK